MTSTSSTEFVAALHDVLPMVARAARLDPRCPVRLRAVAGGMVTVLVRLPFAVLAGRTLRTDAAATPGPVEQPLDATYAAAELAAWLDAATSPGTSPAISAGSDGTGTESGAGKSAVAGRPPPRRDSAWRWPIPPSTGWVRVESVPAEVVRDLVAAGGRTVAQLKAAGSGAAALRPQASDALLDTPVITASDGRRTATVALRQCVAATRLGFVPGGSAVGVDVSGRWTRLAGEFGAVFAEQPGSGLTLL